MQWHKSLVLLFGITFFLPATLVAQSCAAPPGYTSPIYNSQGMTITYYVPHAEKDCGTSIEGCIATSCPGLVNNARVPACLDAVRLGQAKYVTLASATSNYGKYYHLGTITYRSALDNKVYTVPNVIGYVHDTGCAFNGTCSAAKNAQYGFSAYPRPDKLDVCTTVCPTCSDAEASAYASGKSVSRIPSGQGVQDLSSLAQASLGGLYAQNQYPQPQQVNTVSTGYGAQPSGSPVSSGTGFESAGTPTTGTSPTTGGTISTAAVATLIAQNNSVKRGEGMVVSWSSLNMSESNKCQLTIQLPHTDEVLVTTDNIGSKVVLVPSTASVGQATLRLHCVTSSGKSVDRSVSITLE